MYLYSFDIYDHPPVPFGLWAQLTVFVNDSTGDDYDLVPLLPQVLAEIIITVRSRVTADFEYW